MCKRGTGSCPVGRVLFREVITGPNICLASASLNNVQKNSFIRSASVVESHPATPGQSYESNPSDKQYDSSTAYLYVLPRSR